MPPNTADIHRWRHLAGNNLTSKKTKMAVARGAMIVFEGCDRCGKSTQCLKLVEYLRSLGRKVEMMRFPGWYNGNVRQYFVI
jgi:adenylylsulfate kinase-like enzyme